MCQAEAAAKKEDSVHSGGPRLVEFETSPFPFDGEIPGDGKPFLDVNTGGRRGHTSPRGGVQWEDRTYKDRRALLYIPPTFDIKRPAAIVLFFHGNQVVLERDVRRRQQVPRQLLESRINAVLIAPQFAVDALDSSAGHFWESGRLAAFLAEAGARLAEVYGDASTEKTFANMPVVIVAYSGGYLPAAFSLARGGAEERIRGVILLDALYGEIDKFAAFVAKRSASTFFFSAFSKSTSSENAQLQRLITETGLGVEKKLPAKLNAGRIAFHSAGDVVHNDFVTQAWTKDPLKVMLARVSEFALKGGGSEPGTTTTTSRDEQSAAADKTGSDTEARAQDSGAQDTKAPEKRAGASEPQAKSDTATGKGSIGVWGSDARERQTNPSEDAGGKGDFWVLLAVVASTSEANSAWLNARTRCNAELSAYRPGYPYPETTIEGKKFFRVRVENLSKKDATELCSRLKAKDCDCFDVNNSRS